ncbi:MAG: ribbon-helix-helix domain-containing protein [Bacillota bacterium]
MAERPILQRKQIYLERRLEERLKLAAKRSRLTESAIIRRALEEYLDEEDRRRTPAEDNPVLRMIGIFADNDASLRHVSDNKAEYLAKAIARDKTDKP